MQQYIRLLLLGPVFRLDLPDQVPPDPCDLGENGFPVDLDEILFASPPYGPRRARQADPEGPPPHLGIPNGRDDGVLRPAVEE